MPWTPSVSDLRLLRDLWCAFENVARDYQNLHGVGISEQRRFAASERHLAVRREMETIHGLLHRLGLPNPGAGELPKARTGAHRAALEAWRVFHDVGKTLAVWEREALEAGGHLPASTLPVIDLAGISRARKALERALGKKAARTQGKKTRMPADVRAVREMARCLRIPIIVAAREICRKNGGNADSLARKARRYAKRSGNP